MDTPIVAQLAITMDETGRISVNGPIDNEILAYGLLEKARQAIYEHNQQKKRSIVTLPPGSHLRPV